jgi:cation:H+ antiporter
MIITILIFLAGVSCLTFGANMLVTHSSKIAAHFNIRPFIIGVTIIAFGTSAPELVVSLAAAIKGTTAMALGNVLGSNVANIGLILGFTALISPMLVDEKILKKEVPIMNLALALIYIMSLDGEISRLDGLILIAGIVLFTYFCIKSHKSENNNNEKPERKKGDGVVRSYILTVVGLVLLVGGAHYMVESAVIIAKAFGISEMFIGITMVAVGTSLPELAASTAAIIQQKGEMGIGNVVGSNIFNVLLVLGAVAVVKPIPVAESLLSFEYPVMIGFGFLLYILGKGGKRFSRKDGALLLTLYVIFIAVLYNNLNG